MPSQTSRLALPLIAAAQAQKHITHNEAIVLLDDAIHPAVLDAHRTAPPTSPAEGDRHLIKPTATGSWSGHDGEIAIFDQAAWRFLGLPIGSLLLVHDDRRLLCKTSTGWLAISQPQVDRMGVNATADATNRLTVSAISTLFNHAGTHHRVTVNKAGATDTASLVFQTGYSGRAEIGTTGNDHLRFRVSADGATWKTALSIDPATGHIGIDTLSPTTRLDVAGPMRIGQYTVAGMPSAASSGAGALIHVSNEVGGAVIAFSDGTSWRRVTDRAVVS
jgi:hypothetical protein